MSEFLFRLPFAILGAHIGIKYGGDFITMFGFSFIGCIVGDLLMALLVR